MSNEFEQAATAGAPGRPRPNQLVHFIVFQMGWFACVASAAHGVPWLGVIVTAAIVAWHAWRAPRPGPELKLVACAMLIGAVWESFLVACGWLVYPNGTLFAGTAPYWILALWALFAVTLNVTFNWLKGRPALAAVLGAIAGPMSFWGGARMGAVSFAQPLPAVLALALGWAVLMPGLLALTRRWNGFDESLRSGPPRRAGVPPSGDSRGI